MQLGVLGPRIGLQRTLQHAKDAQQRAGRVSVAKAFRLRSNSTSGELRGIRRSSRVRLAEGHLALAGRYPQAGDPTGLRPPEDAARGLAHVSAYARDATQRTRRVGENGAGDPRPLGHRDHLQVYTHAVPESVSQAVERLAQKLMDPNGPKLKDDAVPETEQGAWIQ